MKLSADRGSPLEGVHSRAQLFIYLEGWKGGYAVLLKGSRRWLRSPARRTEATRNGIGQFVDTVNGLEEGQKNTGGQDDGNGDLSPTVKG